LLKGMLPLPLLGRQSQAQSHQHDACKALHRALDLRATKETTDFREGAGEGQQSLAIHRLED
jgi:hypothetical protein